MISLILIRLVETEYDNPTQLQMYLYVKPTASKTPGALRFNFHITSINLVQDFALYGWKKVTGQMEFQNKLIAMWKHQILNHLFKSVFWVRIVILTLSIKV